MYGGTVADSSAFPGHFWHIKCMICSDFFWDYKCSEILFVASQALPPWPFRLRLVPHSQHFDPNFLPVSKQFFVGKSPQDLVRTSRHCAWHKEVHPQPRIVIAVLNLFHSWNLLSIALKTHSTHIMVFLACMLLLEHPVKVRARMNRFTLSGRLGVYHLASLVIHWVQCHAMLEELSDLYAHVASGQRPGRFGAISKAKCESKRHNENFAPPFPPRFCSAFLQFYVPISESRMLPADPHNCPDSIASYTQHMGQYRTLCLWRRFPIRDKQPLGLILHIPFVFQSTQSCLHRCDCHILPFTVSACSPIVVDCWLSKIPNGTVVLGFQSTQSDKAYHECEGHTG